MVPEFGDWAGAAHITVKSKKLEYYEMLHIISDLDRGIYFHFQYILSEDIQKMIDRKDILI
jgi:hypothetical protein